MEILSDEGSVEDKPMDERIEDRRTELILCSVTDDIGANFYPQLGPYSSADPTIITHHAEQVCRMVIVAPAHAWPCLHSHPLNSPACSL